MSNTRRTKAPENFRQERFASSEEFNRGLMANLVARRCTVLENSEERELVWFIQLLSHRSGGVKKLAADLMAQFPERIATDSMRKIGMKSGQIYNADQVRIIRDDISGRAFPLKGEIKFESAGLSAAGLLAENENRRERLRQESKYFPASYLASDFAKCCWEAALVGLEKHLLELCLDPALPVCDGSPWYFPSLVSSLSETQVAGIKAHCQRTVVTSLGNTIHEALDYALETGSATIIDGDARFGKSHSVKDWSSRHPGRTRYVELESGNDEITFFRTIAKSLGVSYSLHSKAQELRARIEDTLHCCDLMLIIDEAHYLWPNHIDARTLPTRINWVLTALVNKGVTVALVTTPQFLLNQREFERRTRWTSEQLIGRIGHYQKLPEKLPLKDYEIVARNLAPFADEETISCLADHGKISQKNRMAAIRQAVDRAGFIARKAGRKQFNLHDVEEAIFKNVMPSDIALAGAIESAATNRPARKRAATVFAAPVQEALQAPAISLPTERIPARGMRPAARQRSEETELTHA